MPDDVNKTKITKEIIDTPVDSNKVTVKIINSISSILDLDFVFLPKII
jgi:hypothetical protein